jgi:hypothetical protein
MQYFVKAPNRVDMRGIIVWSSFILSGSLLTRRAARLEMKYMARSY